jgi:hypothetical protein
MFFEGLVVITLIKILSLWHFASDVMDHHNIVLPTSWIGKIFLAPSFVADWNIHIFFGTATAFLLVALFYRNYITTLLFFWLTLNLYIVYLPFSSGSDMVLFMLAFWCIPMATRPQARGETEGLAQMAAFNLSVLLCRLQIVIVYLVSGIDKLKSVTWRTGEALEYISQLDAMYNLQMTGMFENPMILLILSWCIIGFELGFPVLVWFNKTKWIVLTLGVIFHLYIWIVLCLPHFAAVMIVSYLIFLNDVDVRQFRTFTKRLLP